MYEPCLRFWRLVGSYNVSVILLSSPASGQQLQCTGHPCQPRPRFSVYKCKCCPSDIAGHAGRLQSNSRPPEVLESRSPHLYLFVPHSKLNQVLDIRRPLVRNDLGVTNGDGIGTIPGNLRSPPYKQLQTHDLSHTTLGTFFARNRHSR